MWTDPAAAKALMGVLPDGVRLFDRLSGRELLTYVGRLRRVPPADIASRSGELLEALGLTADADTLVADYSAGMTKKIGLACALVHAPRLLVLDEPFEAVDPVSGEGIRSILRALHPRRRDGRAVEPRDGARREPVRRAGRGGQGRVLASGPLDEVRGGLTLQQRFLELVGFHAGGGGGPRVVALLVRLKLTLLRNSLRRSVWRTVGLVLGAPSTPSGSWSPRTPAWSPCAGPPPRPPAR